MSCRPNYDPCLDNKINQIGSYAAAARQSATNAAASEAAADADASAAAASATQANNYLTQVTNIYDDFSEKYLGSFATPPVTTQEGALYFDTVANSLYVWNGASWVALPTGFNEFTNFPLSYTTPIPASELRTGSEYQIVALGSPATNWVAIGAASATVGERFTKNATAATGNGTARVTRDLNTRFADVVNVKDFGAVGNGATDDTSAIALAVTAAAGKTLYFPAGTYLVSAPKAAAAIFLPVSGITIKGDGKYSTTIKATTDCVLIAAVDADKIDISNIGLDGSQASGLAWQRGILLRGVVNASIRNCLFYRMGDTPINLGKQGYGGSDAVPNGSRQCERIFIEDNEIRDCFGTTAIITKFVGSKQTIISENLITNSCAGGISVESEGSTPTEFAEQIVVSDNIIHKCDFSYAATPVSQAFGIGVTERAKFVIVADNVINDLSGNLGAKGIEVGTSPTQSDAPASQVVVTSNNITNISSPTGRADGIQLQVGDSSLDDITIGNNVISNCGVNGNGIHFIVAFGATTLGSVKNLSITGNVISDATMGMFFNQLSGAGEIPLENANISANSIKNIDQSGIYLFLINSVISNNVIELCAANGIQLLANSTGNVISANNIKYCVDAINSISGDHLLIDSNSCLNNSGYGIRVQAGNFIVITNNNCSDYQTVPTQQYGIRTPAGSTVRNNQLIGNVVATVFGGIAAQNTGTYDAGLNRTA